MRISRENDVKIEVISRVTSFDEGKYLRRNLNWVDPNDVISIELYNEGGCDKIYYLKQYRTEASKDEIVKQIKKYHKQIDKSFL
jgi:chitinase